MPTEEWCLPSGSARVRSQGTTVPDLQDSLPGVQGGDQELRHSVLWERRRPWHLTPVLLPGKSHGRRSLVRCSPWGRKESDTTERLHFHFSLFTFMHWRRKWQPTPVFLPVDSQGRGSLVGCRLWGRTVGHDWNDLAAAAALLHKAKEIYYQIFSSILWFENRWNRSHSYFKMCHCEMTRQKNSWFKQYLF